MMFQPPKFLLQERRHSAMMEYVVKGIVADAHNIGKKRIFYIYDCDSVSGRARGCSWNGCKIRLKV